MLYYFFRSFLTAGVLPLAISTLVIAYVTEFLQLTDFLKYLGLGNNKLANIVFGNSFSIQDLVAYTMGIVVVIGIEKRKLLM